MPMPATISPEKIALAVFAGVGVHLQQAAEALLVARAGVEDLVALLERAGVDPQEGELADVGVGHDLERQGRERLLVGQVTGELLVFLAASCP